MKQLLKNIIQLIILLTVTVQLINAQDTLDLAKIETGVDKYLTYFSNENPGAVVSVMKKGELIFNKAYGLSNVQSQEIMTNDKLFNLGELSKSFTALAILQLAEKNKLSLDDNLKDIFPDFPEYGKKVTVNNILDHKSGLAAYNTETVLSNDEVFDFLINEKELQFEPGAKFEYSNSDYALLAKIIESKSKMLYKDFLRKYIFKKIGMNNTWFSEEIEGKDIAPSHSKEKEVYVVKSDLNNIYGNQGVFTNSVDYARYDKALYSSKLLKCENLQKIFKIGKLTQKENKSDYDYGWVLMAKGGIRYFWQGGQGGYTNLVLHLPDTQTTVLILTNRDDGYDFLKMSIYIAKLFDKDLKL